VLKRILAYTITGIPAVIGVWFVARFAYVTSDTAIGGASDAFLFGMVAIGAYALPAACLGLARNGRVFAAVIFWGLAIACMAGNWTQTLNALASRGAGKEAERVKAADTANFNRDELGRLTAELKKLPEHRPAGTVSADLEAAKAGRLYKSSKGCTEVSKATWTACEAFHKLEGELATAKTADQLEGKIAKLGAAMKEAPAVKQANVLGETLARLLPISAVTAASAQQWFISAIVELLIAAALALPELMHKPATRELEATVTAPIAKTAEVDPPAIRTIERRDNVVTLAPKPKDAPLPIAIGEIEQFMLERLTRAKGSKVSWADLFLHYRKWCADNGLTALEPSVFGRRLDEFRDEGLIRARRQGDDVFCLDVKLAS
jgi:hypothetical protein